MDFLCCVNCCSKLELEVFSKSSEIEEGILECKNCKTLFPIIEKIPVLWTSFDDYLSNRRKLGGKLFNSASNKMKNFIKKSLTSKPKNLEDRSDLEVRWAKIYQTNHQSRFYSKIKDELDQLPHSKFSLEYGCSIGIISRILSNSSDIAFGVDRSFSAIKIAQKTPKRNLDYFVADLLSPIFGKQKFNLIVALNLLELVEPLDFLKHASSQIDKGNLVISDPYDYDRGKNSVKFPLDENSLRQNLKAYGFKIRNKTSKPSKISWNLKLHSRATLNYKVDFVIANK